MPDNDEREQQILDAAAALIVRLGYDKTTMSDIAAEAGASRRTVYLYFKGKEELFEALLYRGRYVRYSQTWLEQIDADPRGGTLGGFCRALLHSVNRHPLIAAMMRRDRRVLGNYLRKPDNIFSRMVSGVNTLDFFQALQAAGAIRQDIDAAVLLHLIEVLSYGQLAIVDYKPFDQFPPYDAVMEAIAEILDRALIPADGGNSAAGKAICRQITTAARIHLEQIKQAKGTKQTTRQGATNDN